MRTGAITIGRAPAGVDEAIKAMMARGSVPGLSICVVDKDGVRLAGGYGSADRGTKTPATASTQYLWFSMTKLVTDGFFRYFEFVKLYLNVFPFVSGK